MKPIFHLRTASPATDLPGIFDLVNAFEPDSFTLADVARWFSYQPAGRLNQRLVACLASGAVIGYSVAVHETFYLPDHFYTWQVVAPDQRRQGIGAALYQAALAYLQAQHAASLSSEVRDDDPAALRFAGQRGFTIDRRLFESSLDLDSFDAAPYQPLLAAQESAGLRIFTLADCGDSPPARRQLYELNATTVRDIPGVPGEYMSFAEFEERICGAEWFDPDGQIIAAIGVEWAGLTAVRLQPHTGGAYNLMTGVLPAFRGRKIALALKLAAIDYARRRGAHYLWTHNDSANAPMLAVNRRLGYKPRPGKTLLRCESAFS